jgi:hypothetical protein
MNRIRARAAIVTVGLVLAGCQSQQIRTENPTLIDASSIPDQKYDITEYRGPMAESYAVLFDIPDDGTELFMKYSPFIDKVGVDSPDGYIDTFHGRIKGHRTLRISDQEGNVKGYLMVSNILTDRVRPAGKRIEVIIEDPYQEYLRSAR